MPTDLLTDPQHYVDDIRKRLVNKALNELGDFEKLIIHGMFWENKKGSDIAREYFCSESNVSIYYISAKEKLRRILT